MVPLSLHAGFWLGFLLPSENMPRRAWQVLGPVIAIAGVAYLVFGSDPILGRVGLCLFNVASGVLAVLHGCESPGPKSDSSFRSDANG